jgi:hypothetical protein
MFQVLDMNEDLERSRVYARNVSFCFKGCVPRGGTRDVLPEKVGIVTVKVSVVVTGSDGYFVLINGRVMHNEQITYFWTVCLKLRERD